VRYVALLRGINVGGNTLMKMDALRECVAALGHDGVRTYIASGNVLFESRERDVAKLDADLEQAIERRFRLPVRVVVRSRAEIEKVVARIPQAWIGADDLRVTVAFLLRGADARSLAAGLAPRPGVDELVAAPGALVWAIRRDALTRSGLRLVGTAPYKQMTLRNLNTTLKLADLLRE
jgi:uncharacterized protein (DUF1697 family)